VKRKKRKKKEEKERNKDEKKNRIEAREMHGCSSSIEVMCARARTSLDMFFSSLSHSINQQKENFPCCSR
jgi:hypothetical protein